MKIKTFTALTLVALAFTIILSGCSSTPANQPANEAVYTGKKIKVGFFVGDGSRSSGVFYWAQLLFYSPQLQVELLDAEDIRSGKLKELDLLLIPGGSSASQCKDLQDGGKKAIQDFVRNGGSYVGICAGFHCTLNRKERLELLPFEYRSGAGGAAATLQVEINRRGAEVMNIRPGKYNVRYSLGPIAKPGKPWSHGKGEILGVYKSTVGPKGRPGGNFFNAPSVIYGNYGKGRIIATSFHPESHALNQKLSMGCIYAVTGITPTPVYPAKSYRPIRAAFFTPSTIGKAPIQRMLELDKHPEIDVQFAAVAEFHQGILNHVDVLIVPDAYDHKNTALAKNWNAVFKKFMDKGGRIYVSGKESAAFIKHPNLIEVPAGESFVPAVLAND